MHAQTLNAYGEVIVSHTPSDKHAKYLHGIAFKVMSQENDLPKPTALRLRYVICASPRTGSTLLGEGLGACQHAGKPDEYFNPLYSHAWAKRMGRNAIDMGEYLSWLYRHRSGTGGIFGAKLHADQFTAFVQQNHAQAMLFLNTFDAAIFIHRNNKIAQALSYARAMFTDQWSEHLSGNGSDWSYDTSRISEGLRAVLEDDARWQAYRAGYHGRVLNISYEQLSFDYTATMQKVVSFLNIELPDNYLWTPKLRKQSTEESKYEEQKFLAYLHGIR